jgi:large subunit ribosomal protein L19
MKRANIIQKLEKDQLKAQICDFRVGDTIVVHTRILEGEKERVQAFKGTVIARKGSGLSETFSVHRIACGEGMERVFLLHSPRIAKIEVLQEGSVRRSKLYYLRGTSGKASKVKPLFRSRKGKTATIATNSNNSQALSNAPAVEASVEN